MDVFKDGTSITKPTMCSAYLLCAEHVDVVCKRYEWSPEAVALRPCSRRPKLLDNSLGALGDGGIPWGSSVP